MRCQYIHNGHRCLKEAKVRGKYYDVLSEQNLDICVCPQHAETVYKFGNPKPAIPLPKEPVTWKPTI